MRPLGPICAAIAGLVLAGCGSSPPARFYTLASLPGPAHGGSASPLVLGKLTVPSILDRPEIATRLTATRLEFSESRRWAAPLDKLVRQTLGEDLSARSGHAAVLASAAPGAAAIAVLDVDISEFDADAAGVVTLDARWTVTGRPRAAPMAADHIRVQLRPSADAGDVAATMSQALAMLADRISARLGR